MKLTNVREAACMQASYWINQITSKKAFKQVSGDLAKMSDNFGIDFDKHAYKTLLEDIDFKDQRTLLSNRNTIKAQYLKEEFPVLLARPDFINIFSSIIESSNLNFTAGEIFDGLVKLVKLNYESQMKILLSFIYSGNLRYRKDVLSLFLNKCHEINGDSKSIDQLSKSTIQHMMLLINSIEDFNQDDFLGNQFLTALLNSKYNKTSENKENDEFIEDYYNILDSKEDAIEYEKLMIDLGPWQINNTVTIHNLPSNQDLISLKIDERRLANFIIYIMKQPQCVEDKETRNLNKIFLQTIGCDLSIEVDDNNEKKQNINWNLENFYKMMKPYLEGLDYGLVFSFFDELNFVIKDKKIFDNFVLIMKHLKISQYQNILINALFSRWTNELNQIETLQYLINNPQTDSFSFKYSSKKVKRNFELAINKNTISHLIENWSSVDLIEALIRLARGNHYLKIKEIFDWPIANIPEILVIGLSYIKVENEDFLYEELISDVLPPFLGNHINSIAVLEEVWSSNRDLVIKTISNLYRSNPDLMNLSRILDIAQKLKDSLIPIVTCNDHTFTVNLAILAVKRDFLHIDQWINDRITKIGDDFIECLLSYIRENVIKQCKEVNNQNIKENILEKCQLTLESLAIIFENLANTKIKNNPKISKRIQAEINTTYKELFEIFDELQADPQNSEEILQQADKIFKNLFHGESTVEQTIEIITKYKNSGNQMENEIYAIMIHSLLDEYKFFQQYPEKELKTMATLFGQIINNRLFDTMIETISVKFIIEGLRKNKGKLFLFAVVAIDQIVDNLQNFTKYLQPISQAIISLKNTHPALYQRLNEKINDLNNKNKNYLTSSHSEDFGQGLHGKMHSGYQLGHNNNEDMDKLEKITSMPRIDLQLFDNTYRDGLNQATIQPQMMGNQPFMYKPNYPYPMDMQYQFYGQMHPNPNMGNNQHLIGKSNIPGAKIQNRQMDEESPMMNNFPLEYSNSFKNNLPTDEKSPQERALIRSAQKISQEDNNQEKKTPIRMTYQPNPDNLTKIIDPEYNEIPPQEIIDKINFCFNLMSKNNIPEKSNDLKNILGNNEVIIKWFSNYFLGHRVAKELNYQPSYSELINHINYKELNNILIKDTITFIKRFINSDKLLKDAQEKNMLKNLGAWLGVMTLAKNRPILAKDLELKEILIESYQTGKLSAILPFVIKILENSFKTKVFHSKNPWILAIMALLVEINNLTNLKVQLKLEIGKIFSKLEIDINSIQPTKLLKNIVAPKNSNDFTKDNITSTTEPKFQENTSSAPLKAKNQDLFNLVNSQNIDQYIADLQSIIKETNSDNILTNQEMISIVTNSLVNAINEIIGPVINRAVNISLDTTKELILKDFSYEADETKFNNGANYCIKSLAGSLAMVTCKEPLRMSFISNLKDSLSRRLNDEDFSIDNINNAEVLDIGCNFIQKNVIKRAIDIIEKDNVILEEIEKRKKGGKIEPKPDLTKKFQNLPDVLKPSVSGLTLDQYKIYEDFEKVYDSNRKEVLKKNNFIKTNIIPLLKEFSIFAQQNISKANDKYDICLKNLSTLVYQYTDIEYTEEDENLSIISKILSQESKITESIALNLVHINIKYIISSVKQRNLTLVNLFSETLKGWIIMFPKLAKEVTIFIFFIDDLSIRYCYDIHSYFLRKNLFDRQEYEKICISTLQDPISSIYIRSVLKKLIEKNILQIKDLVLIPHYMVDRNSENYFNLFFNRSLNTNTPNLDLVNWKILSITNNENFISFKEKIINNYTQVIGLFYKNLSSDVLKNQLKSLNDTPLFKSEEQYTALISIVTEYAVKECLFNVDHEYVYQDRLIYNKVDNLAKFIVTLLNNINNNNNLKFFENILFGVFRVLHLDFFKNQTNFNQKPYYRLFISIINNIMSAEPNDQIFANQKKVHYFLVFADFLRTLRPQNYPGFAFAWLDIISYKHFTGMLLNVEGSNKNRMDYMSKYLFLVTDLLTFLKIYKDEQIKSTSLHQFIKHVYKYMFMLTSSYPEFVSYFYNIILNSLPSEGLTQMRNIILSSTPIDFSDTDQLDPFANDFKLDNPNFKKAPIALLDLAMTAPDQIYKSIIDDYIENKNMMIIDDIIRKLNKKEVYNIHQIINWIVLYLSNFSINKKNVLSDSQFIEILLRMIRNLEAENRDFLIGTILNELRYPNSQTIYFHWIVLCLILDVKNDIIEEHIYRNIIERMLYKPYPWGLIVTYLEITNNPKYSQIIKKSYEHPLEIDKILADITKMINQSKFNLTLDNFVN